MHHYSPYDGPRVCLLCCTCDRSLKEVESYLEGRKVKDARDGQSGKARGHEAGDDNEATLHVAQRVAQERRDKRAAAKVPAAVRLHTMRNSTVDPDA